MRSTISICLLAILSLSGRTLAAPEGNGAALGSNVSITAATLSISGTSSMHDYVVSTKTLTIISAIASAEDAGGLLRPDALQGFEVQVPVSSFTSDKDGLTKQMLKALKADKHPMITFRLKGYAVEPSGGGGITVKPTGTLTVAGVERPIDLVLDVKEDAGSLQVAGSRELLMTEFGIKPPTLFMGMLKTHDKVTIAFAFQLALARQAQGKKGL